MNILKWFTKREIVFTPGVMDTSVYSTSYSKKNSTALNCIDRLAVSVASIPKDLYRKDSSGNKQKLKNHYLQAVINSPNMDETPSLFYTNIINDYFMHGNIYLYKTFNGKGELNGLYRLDPTKVTVSRNKDNIKEYGVNGNTYTSSKLLHIPSRYGYDGLTGQSVFDFYKEAFTLASTLDIYFKNSFKNGFGTGKRLILDLSEMLDTKGAGKALSKEDIEVIKQMYLNDYTGYSNSDRPIIKSVKAANYSTIDVGGPSNKEQQLNENIAIIDKLVCRIFNVPDSFIVGENKYGDIESLYQIYIDFAVMPLVDTILESFQNGLLNPAEKATLFFEANYNALMRTSLTTKIDAYTKQIGNGILSVNEVRAKENLPSIGPAGDYVQTPANLIPLTMEVINARLASQKLSLQKIDNNTEKTGEY